MKYSVTKLVLLLHYIDIPHVDVLNSFRLIQPATSHQTFRSFSQCYYPPNKIRSIFINISIYPTNKMFVFNMLENNKRVFVQNFIRNYRFSNYIRVLRSNFTYKIDKNKLAGMYRESNFHRCVNVVSIDVICTSFTCSNLCSN